MQNKIFKFFIAAGLFGLMMAVHRPPFAKMTNNGSQGRRTGDGPGQCEGLAGTALLEYGGFRRCRAGLHRYNTRRAHLRG